MITLEGVEADEEFVVIRFSVQDLKDDRRNAGRPAALEPVLGTGPPEALPPHIGLLTDEAGGELDLVGAEMESFGPGDGPEVRRTPKANRAVFALPETLESSSNHRFRFEVSLEEIPIPPSWKEAEEEGVRAEPTPPIGPFVFDFEVPVRTNEAYERFAAPRRSR
jgi:hypothetical protein